MTADAFEPRRATHMVMDMGCSAPWPLVRPSKRPETLLRESAGFARAQLAVASGLAPADCGDQRLALHMTDTPVVLGTAL